MNKIIDLKIYFSDFFSVSPDLIEDHGAFNISLINDLPLFIDPFLIFNSEKEEYKELHQNIIKYVVFLKEQAKNDVPPGLIKAWYHFPEVKENWLGFSQMGNSGRGLASKFASSLKVNLTTKFLDFGEEAQGGSHLGKLTLAKNGVGKDNISDFTCNLIKGYLAEYTQSFCEKYIDQKYLKNFNLSKVSFNYETKTWNNKTYKLPKFGNQFVLLTPCDILTKDDAWISHQGLIEDFSHIISSVPNDQLREQISAYFSTCLPDEPRKSDIDAAAEKVIEQFPDILNQYVLLQEADRSGARDKNIEKIQAAQEFFLKNLRILVDRLSNTDFYSTAPNSYEEGMRRINFLKHVIENQDGYRLFYVKGKPITREQDLQIMFKLTWFASLYSSDAEVNNGRGPADFIISYGSADKSVIEFKLAKSSQLEKNILNQAEIYKDAAKSNHPPIKAILFFNQKEFDKVSRLLIKHNLVGCKEIVLIDAQHKDSASKV